MHTSLLIGNNKIWFCTLFLQKNCVTAIIAQQGEEVNYDELDRVLQVRNLTQHSSNNTCLTNALRHCLEM